MGTAASIQESGKLDVTDPKEFEAALAKAWSADDGAQQEQIKQMLVVAKKFVGHEIRAQSVGQIEYPPKPERLEALWTLCDYNGNDMTTLAELDKMIVENFPQYDNKPAIMRAYHACDRNRNGFISKREFVNFMGYLDYFTKLWDKFEEVDDDQDRRISFEEMRRHAKEIFGRDLSDETASVLFNTIDRNGGGKILFYEFCAHMAVLDRKDFAVEKLPFE